MANSYHRLWQAGQHQDIWNEIRPLYCITLLCDSLLIENIVVVNHSCWRHRIKSIASQYTMNIKCPCLNRVSVFLLLDGLSYASISKVLRERNLFYSRTQSYMIFSRSWMKANTVVSDSLLLNRVRDWYSRHSFSRTCEDPTCRSSMYFVASIW